MNMPREVLEFLESEHALSGPEQRINVLTVSRALEYSKALQASSVGETLGLIALVDADDSNPYCYMACGPGKGMVVHFSHDPEPEIHFAGLSDFKAALDKARRGQLDIDDIPRVPLKRREDGEFLATLEQLASLDNEDSEFLLCLFIPLLSPSCLATLELLAKNSSFFVRESVAQLVAAHPLPSHRHLAEVLASDPHPQVARPGRKALTNVRRAEFGLGPPGTK